MMKFKNNLFKVVATLLICASIFGFATVAYADTYEDLAKIFVTRDELSDWNVYYYDYTYENQGTKTNPDWQEVKGSVANSMDIDSYLNVMETRIMARVASISECEAKNRGLTS